MRKWILGLSGLLASMGWSETPHLYRQELQALDQEIDALQQRLHQIKLKEMKEEVAEQGWMIADWERYAQGLESLRQREVEENQLEEHIKQLKERKAQLLKEQTD